MNPPQLAKNHCANWQHEGECSGVSFREDGVLYRFRREGCQCLLKTKERCQYFEDAVLPMKDRKEWPNDGDRKDFQIGAALYERGIIAGLDQRKERKCLHCGKRIRSKLQYCRECAHKTGQST